MQLQSACWHDELYKWASPPVTFKICEMCYLFFNVFVSDMRKRQLNCLQALISGARHATMFLADDNCPAVPEWTKQSCKRFIIVYVWFNNGSTTPAAQAPVHRKTNRGRQAHRLQWLACCFDNREVDECKAKLYELTYVLQLTLSINFNNLPTVFAIYSLSDASNRLKQIL